MQTIKHWWVRGVSRVRDEYEDAQSDIVRAGPRFRWFIYMVAIYFFATFCLGIYWSTVPGIPSVNAAVQRQLALSNIPQQSQLPQGVTTTSTLIAISEVLLNKSGGYLANDVFPPGLWLDNMPHWELGVLLQVRDTTQMIGASLSQSTLNHQFDADLQKAEIRFNFSNTSWAFPATESQYLSGIEHLQKYNYRLMQANNSQAQFFADAAHLNDYLASVEQRLKNMSQRLTASVGPKINTDAAAMPVKQDDLKKATNGLYTKTPWLQLDDVFFEARGSSWALIGILQAIEIDFAEALQTQNAQASFDQIIRELKPTQQAIYSPVILNGDGFGSVANHSLTMASYLARTQAAIADCRRQLRAP
ncbi:MAG: DUF2333 family protein [Gammaproteobacteria bacterium]|nr:MAG: DUF2333 family protein [Gammaproteobacteria bacterium]